MPGVNMLQTQPTLQTIPRAYLVPLSIFVDGHHEAASAPVALPNFYP